MLMHLAIGLSVVLLAIPIGCSRVSMDCITNAERKDCPADTLLLDSDNEKRTSARIEEARNASSAATASERGSLLQDSCSLYLAPSTIPGAGLGVFTGPPRRRGDVIANHDIAIPVPDVWLHLTALGEETTGREDYDYINVLSDYVWKGNELGMQREAYYSTEDEYIWSFEPGVNAAINGHLGCGNVDRGLPVFDNGNMVRSRDPGTGAFTPYYGTETYAISDIPAGGEMFKEYIERWFVDRTFKLGNIPLHSDYAEAEEMLQRLGEMFNTSELPVPAQKDLWEMMHDLPWPKSRTMNAVPRDFDDLGLVLESGIASAHQRKASRPVEDLENHGRCMDNIRPRSSTLKQAGRGAFATRFLPRDSIVTGTPVLFFPSDAFFTMYDGDWHGKEGVNASSIHGHQLLLNYCLKHDESSILLCPYGSGINFVNHNKTLANVRLQWAANGQLYHDETLLKLSPHRMYYHAAPQLVIDLVTLRDIDAGEELFLDYGTAWEEDWLRHHLSWPYRGDPDYVSPRTWNKENSNAVLLTESEQQVEPYPANFQLYCLPEFGFDEVKTLDRTTPESLWEPHTLGYPCKIVDRKELENGEYGYAILYRETEDHHPISDSTESWSESDWIVRREAIRFEDAPYSTDTFLKGAFRHPIGFPENLFPDAWRGHFLEPLPPLRSTG